MRSVLVVNPSAGPWDVRREVPTVLNYLGNQGWQTSLHWTERPGEATDLARRAADRGLDAVFVAGGDGTINEIVNGLAGSPVALGVLPGGTGNVWAKELGLPTRSLRHLQPLLDSVRALVPGVVRRIDIGKANGRYFLQWTGVGLDAEVNYVMEPRTRPQRRLGAVPYLIAGVVTAIHLKGTRTRIWVDGKQIYRRAILVVISNSQLYGGIARIAPDARLDDGLLDVHVFAGTGFSDVLRAALGVLSGLHVRDPHHTCSQGCTIRVECDKPMAVAMDGEPFGRTPVECEVVPRALSVLIPRCACPDLFAR
jgi:diacylglycerol kinase (ATP)